MITPGNDYSLEGKKILLGVCGSIAAYKSVLLLRLLTKSGAQVRVIPTVDALSFVGESTWSTLSSGEVKTGIQEHGAWNNHVELGLWADVFIIAPATAQTIAKLTHGFADNLLAAVFLSARCPVFIAPAMDLDMWNHQATQTNIKLLKDRGTEIIPPSFGALASGLIGEGRLPEPEELFEILSNSIIGNESMKGIEVIITGGPTVEAIDPVRFISNHSTGKMSIALANELANRGANVILVLGPVPDQIIDQRIKVIPVKTALEMLNSCKVLFETCKVAIFTAAVADYRPAETQSSKIKKQDSNLTLELVKNPDIAAEFGSVKKAHQLSVGFALETNDELINAKAKIAAKNFDLIVMNSLQDKGAGFATDTNKVTLLFPDRENLEVPLQSKQMVAKTITDVIAKHPKIKTK